MAGSRPKRKATFLWQGVLILLPVVLLAAAGLFSLRRDQLLTRQEASQRAQTLADDLFQKIWTGLTATKEPVQLQPHAFQVDVAGQLVFPPPSARLPVPSPPAMENLNSEQVRLWRSAQAQPIATQDSAVALQAWRDFVDSNPPVQFAAPARYVLGLLLAKAGDNKAAAQMFTSVAEQYPDAVGESGLPLQPLAQLKLVELEVMEAGATSPGYVPAVAALCSNAVYRPTLLTPHLLKTLQEEATAPQAQKEVQKWQSVWQGHEETRELFEAAGLHFSTPHPLTLPPLVSQPTVPPEAGFSPPLPAGAFWFATPWDWRSFSLPGQAVPLGAMAEGRDWLAMPFQDSALNHWFLCLPGYEVGNRITALLAGAGRMPEYFGVGVEVAGKRITPDLRVWHILHYMTKGGGQEKKEYLDQVATEVLASATHTEDAAAGLRVNIYLTSPTALFEHQRNRTFWFGALIAASALAALAGLLAAYRSFHRQLRLSEMKTNFVSSVSHELRAPIASVRLMAESLERGKVSDRLKQQEYFRFIGQECRRLSSLIENVLDFSRIDQGRKQYEFEPTDLVALTGQTVILMKTYAAERQIQLDVQLPDPQPSNGNLQPLADGKALQQALINLIDNAIKHSPKGETVTVGLEITSHQSGVRSQESKVQGSKFEAGLIALWVEDHGEGIPAAEHGRIFERFYRVGSELRRETQGVGIGLSIVKHVVEAHGGKVAVRSAVGQGSRFTIELPLLSGAQNPKSEFRNPNEP